MDVVSMADNVWRLVLLHALEAAVWCAVWTAMAGAAALMAGGMLALAIVVRRLIGRNAASESLW